MSTALIAETTLSHGTIECEDCLTSREFYQRFLGLGSVRPLPEAQYLWNGGAWSLVCVAIGDRPKPQTIANRFCLRVSSAAEVEEAHTAAHEDRERYGIRDIGELQTVDGVRTFLLRDLDGNWWEISDRSAAYHDDIFERGDFDRDAAGETT